MVTAELLKTLVGVRLEKIMNIILEGLWYGPVKTISEAFATSEPEGVDRFIMCPPVPESPHLTSWVESLTKSMELWRKHASTERAIMFRHSPWSCAAYTQVYSQMYGHVFAAEESDLFNQIVDGLSELMLPPDLVLIFNWDMDKPTITHQDLYYGSNLDTLKSVQKSLHRWGELLEGRGVKVLYIDPPKNTDDFNSWRSWYLGVNHVIAASIKEMRTQNG